MKVFLGKSSPARLRLLVSFAFGAQNGVYPEIGAVRRRNLIEGDTLPMAPPFSHPILLLLDNKKAVVLVGVRRTGPEEVAISDPVFRDGEPFFLARKAWHA